MVVIPPYYQHKDAEPEVSHRRRRHHQEDRVSQAPSWWPIVKCLCIRTCKQGSSWHDKYFGSSRLRKSWTQSVLQTASKLGCVSHCVAFACTSLLASTTLYIKAYRLKTKDCRRGPSRFGSCKNSHPNLQMALHKSVGALWAQSHSRNHCFDIDWVPLLHSTQLLWQVSLQQMKNRHHVWKWNRVPSHSWTDRRCHWDVRAEHQGVGLVCWLVYLSLFVVIVIVFISKMCFMSPSCRFCHYSPCSICIRSSVLPLPVVSIVPVGLTGNSMFWDYLGFIVEIHGNCSTQWSEMEKKEYFLWSCSQKMGQWKMRKKWKVLGDIIKYVQ